MNSWIFLDIFILVFLILQVRKLFNPACDKEGLRPWGRYTVLLQGSRYKIKEIEVSPGAKLSLQMHHHRSEHWVVIQGTAKVTKGEEEFFLTENESIYIPIGQKHRLENPGLVPLKIVEVQNGSYVGEDDIVRFEDVYGRETEKVDHA